jgi:hypothetical protein
VPSFGLHDNGDQEVEDRAQEKSDARSLLSLEEQTGQIREGRVRLGAR